MVAMKKGITLGKLTKQFWNSMEGYQRAFLSLTNPKNNFNCDKDWNELTRKQQSDIFKHIWRNSK